MHFGRPKLGFFQAAAGLDSRSQRLPDAQFVPRTDFARTSAPPALDGNQRVRRRHPRRISYDSEWSRQGPSSDECCETAAIHGACIPRWSAFSRRTPPWMGDKGQNT